MTTRVILMDGIMPYYIMSANLHLQSSLDIEKSPLLTKRKVVTAGKEESGEEEVDSADVPVIMVKTTEEDDWVNIDFRSEEVSCEESVIRLSVGSRVKVSSELVNCSEL